MHVKNIGKTNSYEFFWVPILSNMYPDIKLGFYVLRRNKYVHMRLDNSVLSYKECYDTISDVSQIWNENLE